jgi:hypothetical protein
MYDVFRIAITAKTFVDNKYVNWPTMNSTKKMNFHLNILILNMKSFINFKKLMIMWKLFFEQNFAKFSKKKTLNG